MKDERGLLTLAAEIRQELDSLARLAEEIPATWEKRESVARQEQPTYVESIALKLHNFYTACERIFERVAGELNGALPKTHDWHLRLLRTMSLEVPELRPRLLSSELAERLTDYLRFRHLVRNVYGFELDAGKMAPLVDEIGSVFEQLDAEVRGFVEYLEGLGHGISE